jgi:hypothetical protein
MDFTLIFAFVVGLALFAAMATVYGADSRPWDTDENQRPWL